VDEFVPQLRADGRFLFPDGLSVEAMRTMVRTEAFDRFLIDTQYRERLGLWRKEKNLEHVKGLIKKLIPLDIDHDRRAWMVGAMRKVILEGNVNYGPVPRIKMTKASMTSTPCVNLS